MQSFKDFLKGKKSYILAVAGVIYAVVGYYTGHFDAQTAQQMIWAALSLSALRAGINNAVRTQV